MVTEFAPKVSSADPFGDHAWYDSKSAAGQTTYRDRAAPPSIGSTTTDGGFVVPRLFISRMLETFFRRWWLFLLPVVLLGAVGVYSALGSGTTYRSIGVILVNRNTLLSELSAINSSSDGFGGDTPATYTSRQMNTLLQTDGFLDTVIDKAGLNEAVDTGALTRQGIRRSVGAQAAGDELVGVIAGTDNAELSLRLATSAIDSFKDWEVNNLQADSGAAITALQSRIDEQKDLIKSATTSGVEPTTLAQLKGQLSAFEQQLAQAQQVDQSSASDVAQRLRTVDEPVLPTAPESSRQQDIQTVALFLVLGAIVSAAALVVLTILDRSVRYGEEIEARLHLPVLATIPDSPAALKPRLT